MKRQRQLHATERQIRPAAQIAADGVFDAMILRQPGRNLIVRDHRCARAIRDLRRIRDMIEMTMRNENEIRLGILRFNRRRRRIIQKRIDQHRVLRRLDLPARMAQPGEFGGHVTRGVKGHESGTRFVFIDIRGLGKHSGRCPVFT